MKSSKRARIKSLTAVCNGCHCEQSILNIVILANKLSKQVIVAQFMRFLQLLRLLEDRHIQLETLARLRRDVQIFYVGACTGIKGRKVMMATAAVMHMSGQVYEPYRAGWAPTLVRVGPILHVPLFYEKGAGIKIPRFLTRKW